MKKRMNFLLRNFGVVVLIVIVAVYFLGDASIDKVNRYMERKQNEKNIFISFNGYLLWLFYLALHSFLLCHSLLFLSVGVRD